MVTFATGLLSGFMAGIGFSFIFYFFMVHTPYKRFADEKLTAFKRKEGSYLRIIHKKDVIIEKQDQFIRWAKKELNKKFSVKNLINNNLHQN